MRNPVCPGGEGQRFHMSSLSAQRRMAVTWGFDEVTGRACHLPRESVFFHGSNLKRYF